jgi:RNA polymerase sigma factor (sigma-70 family)
MENVEFDPHLSQMSTQWTMVFKAHSDDPDEAHIAASRLMCRYAGAVHRYLLKALKDPDAADELDQEFALRFLRGDFKNSDPKRGRFRDYVKRAVQNLINDYYRRKRPLISLDAHALEPAATEAGIADFEQQFIDSWRKDLLERAWSSLEDLERNTGQPYHTVLRTKVSHPDLTSEKLAQQLSTTLQKPYTPGAVRQTLQRSRQKYVTYLLDEVRASLDNPSRDDLEQELGDLNLLHYCRPFMKRQDQKG